MSAQRPRGTHMGFVGTVRDPIVHEMIEFERFSVVRSQGVYHFISLIGVEGAVTKDMFQRFYDVTALADRGVQLTELGQFEKLCSEERLVHINCDNVLSFVNPDHTHHAWRYVVQ
ncbi:hypothetical protein HPB47_000984, partial [Ixodes persulcatus]